MAGSEKRIKTTTTTLRLSPEERESLNAVAEMKGLGPSSLARLVVVRELGLPDPDIRRKPDSFRKDIARLLGEIGKIGNNINQIARHANSTGEADIAAVKSELERLTLAVMSMREPA